MNKENKDDFDIIDDDLYEDFTDEEMYELVQEARQEALMREKERKAKKQQTTKRPFPKWAFWLIASAMMFNIIALLPQTFSIPAIDFLITSAKLSTQSDIKSYKKAVVVIETNDSKGTGYSISEDGTILTNEHVVGNSDTVTVAFPGNGLFNARVAAVYPDIDMAVLETLEAEEQLPRLTLADETEFTEDEAINFIGNPLRFQGIANEGTILDYIHLQSWEEEVVMIQAPVYRGNSGSPVINKEGKVIGTIFATLDHSDYGKVGLFVPIDYYYREHEQTK